MKKKVTPNKFKESIGNINFKKVDGSVYDGSKKHWTKFDEVCFISSQQIEQHLFDKPIYQLFKPLELSDSAKAFKLALMSSSKTKKPSN